MSVLNAVVKQLNKAIIKATTAGDTRAVNKLTKCTIGTKPQIERLEEEMATEQNDPIELARFRFF